MKRKMKLTDLRHVETSKEEMSFVKGGDGSENGPLCWGCSCSCNCSGNNSSSENSTNNGSSNQNGSTSGVVTDIIIKVLSF